MSYKHTGYEERGYGTEQFADEPNNYSDLGLEVGGASLSRGPVNQPRSWRPKPVVFKAQKTTRYGAKIPVRVPGVKTGRRPTTPGVSRFLKRDKARLAIPILKKKPPIKKIAVPKPVLTLDEQEAGGMTAEQAAALARAFRLRRKGRRTRDPVPDPMPEIEDPIEEVEPDEAEISQETLTEQTEQEKVRTQTSRQAGGAAGGGAPFRWPEASVRPPGLPSDVVPRVPVLPPEPVEEPRKGIPPLVLLGGAALLGYFLLKGK